MTVNKKNYKTCFQKHVEFLLQSDLSVCEESDHRDFKLEVCARLKTFHSVLGLHLRGVIEENVRGRLRVRVVKSQRGHTLQPVQFPCQLGSSGGAEYMKGGLGHRI